MVLTETGIYAFICFALTVKGHAIAYPEGKYLKLTSLGQYALTDDNEYSIIFTINFLIAVISNSQFSHLFC